MENNQNNLGQEFEFDFFYPDMELVEKLESSQQQYFLKIIKFYKNWKEDLEKDFIKQIKSLKPIFKQKGLYIPNDPIPLFEIFFKKYEESNKNSFVQKIESIDLEVAKNKADRETLILYPRKLVLGKNEILYLADPKIDPKFLLEWTKEYTENLFDDVQNIYSNRKKVEKHSGGVRYQMLETFFELKKEHKDLQVKQVHYILGVILGVGKDTAKAYRNGRDTYITEKAETEVKELIEKIRKGYIL